jgi:transcriptional regulator with XRE-family HTH domain
MHIGQKILEVMKQRRITKAEVSKAVGMSRPAINYLTKRPTMDVNTLAKIGNSVKYDFFKHYPIIEVNEGFIHTEPSAEATENKKLQDKISELERQLENCKRDLMIQKQENVYLKKINALLEKTK